MNDSQLSIGFEVIQITLEVISYGGGVQSTAMILMSIDGLLPKPDLVIFSNTGSELPSTYSTVDSIEELCQKHDIQFLRVSSKIHGVEEGISLHRHYLEREKAPFLPMVNIPSCTGHFKIYPVRRAIKSHPLLDTTIPKPHANTWLGITTDESHRVRTSDVQWLANKFPLIEKDISRRMCVEYIKTNYPHLNVSKSGCFCCPYSSPKNIIDLKVKHPDLFQIVVDMERTAKSKGHRNGIFAGKSIEGYTQTSTLKTFGLLPEDFECSSSQGGCFL